VSKKKTRIKETRNRVLILADLKVVDLDTRLFEQNTDDRCSNSHGIRLEARHGVEVKDLVSNYKEARLYTHQEDTLLPARYPPWPVRPFAIQISLHRKTTPPLLYENWKFFRLHTLSREKSNQSFVAYWHPEQQARNVCGLDAASI
jgi:hypothetical protein